MSDESWDRWQHNRNAESGWIDNKEDKQLVIINLKEGTLKSIIHCINTNATLDAHIKEALLVEIRREMSG